MRPTGYRVHPLLYILIGLLMGGGLGFILFWGFPADDPSGQQAIESEAVEAGAIVPVTGESASFGMEIGAIAPDFVLEDVTGEEVQLSNLRGDVVLLNFWATWCGPCLVEMPLLESDYQAYKDEGIHVLAVNDGESRTIVEQFGQENGLSFPLLLDPERVVQRLYQIRGYPTSVFVDSDGSIAYIHIGLMQESQLAGYMKALGLGS